MTDVVDPGQMHRLRDQSLCFFEKVGASTAAGFAYAGWCGG